MTLATIPSLTDLLARQCNPDAEREHIRRPFAICVHPKGMRKGVVWNRWYAVGGDGFRMLAVDVSADEAASLPNITEIQPLFSKTVAYLLTATSIVAVRDVPLDELRAWLGAPVPNPPNCDECGGEGANTRGMRCPVCKGEGCIIPPGWLRRGWVGDYPINRNLVALALDGLPDAAVALGVTRGKNRRRQAPVGGVRVGSLAIIGTGWRALVMSMGGPQVAEATREAAWADEASAPACPWWQRSGAAVERAGVLA